MAQSYLEKKRCRGEVLTETMHHGSTRDAPVQRWAGMRRGEEKNNEDKLDVYVTSVDLPPPSPPSELHYRKYFRQPRPEVHSPGKLKGGETANLKTQNSVQYRSRFRAELVHSG